MSRTTLPTQFMAKTWIFWAQACFLGMLATFCLIMGPLFYFDLIESANGKPGTQPGIILSLMGVPFTLVFAQAVYNLLARRRPLLRLYREGIEIVLIGTSSLDRIPLIPPMIRVAWRILSREAFRQKVVRIPWKYFQAACVSGIPMAHYLTIEASPAVLYAEDLPPGSVPMDQVVLAEAMFKTPLDEIAAAIRLNARSSIERGDLPSWSVAVPTHA